MRHLHLFLLTIFFYTSCEKDIHIHPPVTFAENSSETTQIGNLRINLDPALVPPHELLFVSPTTAIEPSARVINPDGSIGPFTSAYVVMSEKELSKLRVLINSSYNFPMVTSYKSTRTPDTKIPAPELEDYKDYLTEPTHSALTITATNIYQDAYYITEVGSIETVKDAITFLNTLKGKLAHEDAIKMLEPVLDKIEKAR